MNPLCRKKFHVIFVDLSFILITLTSIAYKIVWIVKNIIFEEVRLRDDKAMGHPLSEMSKLKVGQIHNWAVFHLLPP